MAEQLKSDFSGTTYAQFAALHLARIAVAENDLAAAEEQLRWVLGEASKGSDTAQLAQLRLARVLAASGDSDQALAILDSQEQGTYQASYAIARGDILLSQGKAEDARLSYAEALSLAAVSPGQINLATLQRVIKTNRNFETYARSLVGRDHQKGAWLQALFQSLKWDLWVPLVTLCCLFRPHHHAAPPSRSPTTLRPPLR